MDNKIEAALKEVMRHCAGEEEKLGEYIDKVLFVLINYLLSDPYISQDEEMAAAIYYCKELRDCFLCKNS